jgi:hypothetical protein
LYRPEVKQSRCARGRNQRRGLEHAHDRLS